MGLMGASESLGVDAGATWGGTDITAATCTPGNRGNL